MAEDTVAGSWCAMREIMVRLNYSFGKSGGEGAAAILWFVSTVQAISTDYRALVDACGVLDRSERGKLALTGAEAKSFLQGQVSNDVEALSPGAGCYATFLTPKGKMLGDLRILDAG